MVVSQIVKEELGEFSRYAMIILSTLSLYSNNDEHRDTISSISREMAHRLAGCLDDNNIHETTRLLAIQLMGQGWDLWQKFVNPFSVLQSLIDLLYKNGFVAAEGTGQQLQTSVGIEQLSPEARRIRKEFIKKCRQSIRGIALQNSTLLVSVLSIYIRSQDHLIDARIAALRLLTSFITPTQSPDDDDSDNGALLNDVHLPTIISNVVHLLEPANTTAREVSATGGVSLVNEITQFLTTALQQYPSTLAFHKAQQRLAVALIGTHGNAVGGSSHASSAAEPNLILGFVYDLRSGTAMAMLSARATHLPIPPPLGEPKGTAATPSPDDIYIGSGITQLSNLVFSPDGKHLAGLLTVPTAASARGGVAIVVVWKIGFGFMSLLHNISLALPSPASALGASAATSPSILTPRTGSTPTRSSSPTRGHSHSLPYNSLSGSSLGGGSGGVPDLVVNSGAGAGAGAGSSGHSSPSIPSTPAAVLEDQTNANKLTVYPKLLKAVRVPSGVNDKGGAGVECTVSWRSDKILVLRAGAGFAQDIKISM